MLVARLPPMERVDVLVIGAGSAGLSVSHELASHGIDHVVLERGRIGQRWRSRWESFCLVTPNWSFRLPGAVPLEDPDGFLPRDEIVAYLEGYATASSAPVREGVAVRTIDRDIDDGFIARTSDGDLRARHVAVCTGPWQVPRRPPNADTFPPDLLQIDVDGYRNAASLPSGSVLVIGSGQSGAQLAEELREVGRDVVLSCGKAGWVPRRIGDHDLVWWLDATGFLELTAAALPFPAARLWPNPLATGHGGGHDLHLRTLQALGVRLVGHFLGCVGREARFAPDLAASVAWGDARYTDLRGLIQRTADELGIPRPDLPDPTPFDDPGAESLALDGFGAVIHTGGFRADFGSWLPWPDAFDDQGLPIQVNGSSSVVDGLHFVGTPFLRKRKSSILFGVGEDATVVAGAIAGQLGAT
jgi:putative flavoprotein involved in K+ transport